MPTFLSVVFRIVGAAFKGCVASLLLLLALPLATASASSCGGTNLLTELASSTPSVHKRVLEQGRKTSNGEAILWKVERDGVAPSYLFGTVHIHDPRVLEFAKELTDAIPTAATLALELKDFSDEAIAAGMTSLGNKLVFTDGRSLKSHLTTEQMAVVAKALAPMGATPEVAALFQPWFVALAMAISPCQTQVMASGKLGVDETLAKLANENGVPIVGLETVREQMVSASSVSFERQLASLKSSIELYERADDMMETMISAYVDRKLTALIPLYIELAKDKDAARVGLEDMQRNLLNLRNVRMHERALPLIEKGNAIVAVGALHLPGEQGLVAMFRASGYSVTAVD